MPEFSVIVPVYNVEKYLTRCIESIMSQLYTNFELILVNDGSTDNSGKICDEYAEKDQRIKVIHQKNKGVSAARNKGIKSAIGKYIVFVDSDDMVEKDYLVSMAEIDEEVDLVICGVKQVAPDGSMCIKTQYKRKKSPNITQTVVLEMLLNDAISSIYSKRFKKQIIEAKRIYLNEKLDLGEDGCFVTEYVCNCRCIQYDKTIAYRYFRYEHETLSTLDKQCLKRVAKSNKEMETIFVKYFPEIITNHIWEKKKYQLYPHCIFDILRNEKKCKKKYKLLKSIFEIEDFQDFVKNLNVCMAEDSKLIRKIISVRNPFLLMSFWKLCEFKERLIFAKKERNV